MTGEVWGEYDVRGSGLTQFSWVEGGEVRPPGMLTDVQIWGAGARACGQSLRAVLKSSSMWQWGAGRAGDSGFGSHRVCGATFPAWNLQCPGWDPTAGSWEAYAWVDDSSFSRHPGIPGLRKCSRRHGALPLAGRALTGCWRVEKSALGPRLRAS